MKRIKRFSCIAIFLFLMTCFLSSLSYAQQDEYQPYGKTRKPLDSGELVSKEYAQQYYEECSAKLPRRFTPEAHEEYCTCTAAAMQALITTSDVYYMNNEPRTDKGKMALVKMTEQVYIPCMEFPVQEIVYLECLLNRQKDRRIQNIPQFCTCVGAKVANYTLDSGALEALNIYLYYKEHFESPVDALLHSPGFISKKKFAGRACLKEMYKDMKEQKYR